ncbi:hypothetical protein GLOIN_2v1612297 [Rhizophagus irregularis DAOM 181602=DAOM 197198]|nr:hypothetical protein GLOIN_2v1612297 [Rhizophagus irregularis DAOM 181602=DAOM 197198]
MNKWFCDNDKKFIKKNFESILQVPELIGEENSFVLKVEDMITKIYGDFIYKSKDQADILDLLQKVHNIKRKALKIINPKCVICF